MRSRDDSIVVVYVSACEATVIEFVESRLKNSSSACIDVRFLQCLSNRGAGFSVSRSVSTCAPVIVREPRLQFILVTRGDELANKAVMRTRRARETWSGRHPT